MKLPPEMQKLIRSSQKEVRAFIESHVKPGDVLTWKIGPLCGRRAIVRSIHWDEYDMTVYVFVATYRRNESGFLCENSAVHRRGHVLDHAFERKKL